ncbi:MAG: ferredoxin:thioredoxin reductase [Candidatus Altiarchaeales archaeon]|nr:ferredoxin:thioredoxin reductase [Candidatus Altiarchaeales archaeon]
MDKKKYIEAKKRYAEGQGFALNSDEKVVDMIVDGLIENVKKYGAAYCPCRPISGNKEEDKKNICPCIYHKDEIARDGKCHCWLFVKK